MCKFSKYSLSENDATQTKNKDFQPKTLDKSHMPAILIPIIYTLIKSGGGTGPMKPDNLLRQGAKSGEEIDR